LCEPVSLRVAKATSCDVVSSCNRQALIHSLVPPQYVCIHILLYYMIHILLYYMIHILLYYMIHILLYYMIIFYCII
jgi:hypothetical protein